MASEERGKDEMDYLFEGMVLFNPSKMADDDQHPEEQEQEQEHEQERQQQKSPSTSDFIRAKESQSASQPLDENLFSDLTLITPVQNQLNLLQVQTQPDLLAPTTSDSEVVPTSLVTRQFSTRKKKRAGLRIGYGRDASIPDDQSPPCSHSVPTTLHGGGQLLKSKLPSPSDPLPLPTSSLPADSIECGGSAPQPHPQSQQTSGCPPLPPDCQISTSLSLSYVQPDSPPSLLNATSTVQGDFKGKDIKSFHSNAGNCASRADDDFVSDAKSSATVLYNDLQSIVEQVNTDSPIELVFEQIKVQISEKLRNVRQLVASVSSARKEFTRKRRKAAEALNLASVRYRELEKELEEACEAEDFEIAERVSESLASAENVKEQLAIDLRHAEEECGAIDSKMQEVLECQISTEKQCASILKNFAADAANAANLLLKDAEVASRKELEGWLSSTEDIELKKMELDIESHLVNSARLGLSDCIECSIENDTKERELLCNRKAMLTKELEKLLALVKEKEAEIAETDHNIETVDKRIADVVSSFQELKSSIDAKYDTLQTCISQMQLDNEALTKKKKEIDNFLSQKNDRVTRLQEIAQISEDEANMYQEIVRFRKSLVLFILKSREDKARLAKMEERYSEDVHKLRQEISASRASLQELSTRKSSFQQEIGSLKQRLVFIDKRVPELEAEKKVAAAARNFKEAARIATESKSLSVEKEDLEVKIAGSILEVAKLEEDICNTVNRLEVTEGQISTKEKEVAMARFQRLRLIAGAARAERTAALELGDPEEAEVLLAEAEAADSEAQKIQSVHNFNEEQLVNLPNQYISMELVSNLGGKQLADLAASACAST